MNPRHVIEWLAMAYIAERGGHLMMTISTLKELANPGGHSEIKITTASANDDKFIASLIERDK